MNRTIDFDKFSSYIFCLQILQNLFNRNNFFVDEIKIQSAPGEGPPSLLKVQVGLVSFIDFIECVHLSGEGVEDGELGNRQHIQLLLLIQRLPLLHGFLELRAEVSEKQQTFVQC